MSSNNSHSGTRASPVNRPVSQNAEAQNGIQTTIQHMEGFADLPYALQMKQLRPPVPFPMASTESAQQKGATRDTGSLHSRQTGFLSAPAAVAAETAVVQASWGQAIRNLSRNLSKLPRTGDDEGSAGSGFGGAISGHQVEGGALGGGPHNAGEGQKDEGTEGWGGALGGGAQDGAGESSGSDVDEDEIKIKRSDRPRGRLRNDEEYEDGAGDSDDYTGPDLDEDEIKIKRSDRPRGRIRNDEEY